MMNTISDHRLYLLVNGIVDPDPEDVSALIEEVARLRERLAVTTKETHRLAYQNRRIEELEDEVGSLEDQLSALRPPWFSTKGVA